VEANYLKILKVLNEHPNRQIDISSVLLQIYPSENVRNFDSYKESKTSLFLLLNNMQDEGLIKYVHPNIGGGNEINGYSWLHQVPVYATITIKGQTTLNANKGKLKQFLSNNFWQLVVGILATIISSIIIWKCNIPTK